MSFELVARDKNSQARAGLLQTAHGEVQTPIFMPVGTAGSVKAVNQQELEAQVKAQIILGNTYHLYLRPGLSILKEAGGLHKFMSWNKPILTDSGGFQVYSLSHRRKMKEEGVTFQSHIDGSRHLFSPENVVDTQRIIGSDIMMALDECTPGTADYNYARSSMELTHRWLDRGLQRYNETEPLYGYEQYYFPIVQGCVYPDLRRQSAEYIASKDCAGYAIGGLAVGEPAEKMYEMIEVVNEILPLDRPRYLMGVGTPENLLEAIERGVDMFDCVLPTRNGRNASLFTKQGKINMRNKRWANDFSPIEAGGAADIDLLYSKAYLRHLFIADELLALQLASIHNLAFYLWLITEARKHIINQDFAEWKKQMISQWVKQ
ncbi:MAG: tRNA guanosine(34) transglycosylase Tgt [Bacteroidales bacterium]|jgi:queuine tRNA-ribosyltransferase|nr:tRNA guanosine(34) transglycosylase Tgt [Bacteroidales bacterium]MDD2617259.1 tRNA guanosine(34) transglycosylase Tgt [Bacteroidales bacterium]MDD4641455.1 tRNA guanosine(34) transglycosylase Tgt [Bacteroidales bacterium]NLB02476.1 tRNA guanosine(34) transglycosylase Tgt [Bacteroidales bacterium]